MGNNFNQRTIRKEKPEFEQKLLGVDRVVRVMAGGRRFSFRAVMVIGDKNGRVGVGVAKGPDVAQAVEKAVASAKKKMLKINIINGTIKHETEAKYSTARIILKPAKAGKGLVAGGAVRIICELAGIENLTGKIISRSSNKLNNARATLKALGKLA